ncbi:MAG: transglycosylase SLT domain-containing protein [Xanthomonadales bacterium]|nr:transglycosylase SLT domain-containing protein [Xanthomonadales bacterium]
MDIRTFSGLVALVILTLPVALAIPDRSAGAATGSTTASQRLDFAAASLALAAGRDADFERLRQGLEAYVLAAYLDYARLRGQVRTVSVEPVKAFLEREQGTQLAARFRGEWLAELARREDWRAFRVFDTSGDDAGRQLRCLRLRAAIAGAADGPVDNADAANKIKEAMLALWATGDSLPDACDPAIAHARAQGWLGPEQFRQRLHLAMAAGNAGLMAYLARQLPAQQQPDAERLVAAVRDPEGTLSAARNWPASASAQAAAAQALTRRARQDVDRAIEHWQALAPTLDFPREQRQAVLRELALYAAVAYRADAADWFDRVEGAGEDEQLVQWQVRAALAAGDWQRVRDTVAKLPAGGADDSRWRYWQARALAALGERDAAAEVYRDLAREAGYHGFLAADRLGVPYALCPLTAAADQALAQRLYRRIDFQRALELQAVGWLPEATRAWNHALADATGPERLQAVLIADDRGWHDRAIWMLGAADALGYYSLRFPLAELATVKREAAANDLDPAWVLALIRAESAWRADARSPANARGLMQLLPATGQRMARELGITWSGAGSLQDPTTNIRLGTRYLARQLERFGGSPWLASAAYNAGPRPVERWLAARSGLPADIFIETIPYSETRDYVPRLMAFSVIYDWRLHGQARPMSQRLLMPGQAARMADAEAVASHPFTCPAPAVTQQDTGLGYVPGRHRSSSGSITAPGSAHGPVQSTGG